MRLQYIIAIQIAFIVSLASIILGLGANDVILPTIVGCAVLASLLLSDFTRILRLNHWVSNILIILIVAYSVGNLVHNRGEELAIGIAQILQLVQIVVLFQEKKSRNRFHLLLISFLQVVVASVFQQDFVFALLLAVYVFANFSVFTFIFLNEEHFYFAQHSFVRRYFLFTPSGLRDNFNVLRLLKIIGATVFLGPLSLVLSYRREDAITEQKTVVPKTAQRTSWFSPKISHDAKKSVLHEETEGLKLFWQKESSNTKNMNWPFLLAQPVFVGGTNRESGLTGGRLELFRHLGITAFWSLLFGIIFFLLIPRYNEIVLFGDRYSHSQWRMESQLTGITQIGFTEEIHLGNVGAVLLNESQSLGFHLFTQGINTSCTEKEIPELLLSPHVPYHVSPENEFYLRGVVLDQYSNGHWSSRLANTNAFFSDRRLSERRYRESLFYEDKNIANLFFANNTDFVVVQSKTIAKESPVLCTFWPFWLHDDRQSTSLFLVSDRTEMPGRVFDSPEPFTLTYAVTGFREGRQLDLTPCFQPVELAELLELNRVELSSLVALAHRWDEESGFSPEQVYERARYFEQRLLSDDHFSYKLGWGRRQRGMDPLEDFVKNNPQGHCEFFAGTLAMMLRACGIPARVCVGYKVPAASQDETGYIVRESQAHSWVEAYLAPEQLPEGTVEERFAWHWQSGGWLRLDATPVGNEEVATFLQRTFLNFSMWRYHLHHWWRTNILNMGQDRQLELVYQPLTNLFVYVKDHIIQPEFWQSVFIVLGQQCKNLYDVVRSGIRDHLPLFLWGLGGLFLSGLGVIWGIRRTPFLTFLSCLWNRLSHRGDSGKLGKIAVGFYYRFETLLGERGLTRNVAETQREFGNRVFKFLVSHIPVISSDGENLKNSVQDIVEAYYQVRFGQFPLQERDVARLEQCLLFLRQIVLPETQKRIP